MRCRMQDGRRRSRAGQASGGAVGRRVAVTVTLALRLALEGDTQTGSPFTPCGTWHDPGGGQFDGEHGGRSLAPTGTLPAASARFVRRHVCDARWTTNDVLKTRSTVGVSPP